MNAIELLKTQHREIRSLFAKIEHARDGAERRDCLGRIADKLRMHTALEEEIFYPAVKTMELDAVFEAYEQHHVVDLLVDELPDIRVDDERFRAKMTVLRDLIEHHVAAEENELFPLGERLGHDELDAMGAEMAARIHVGGLAHETAAGPQGTHAH